MDVRAEFSICIDAIRCIERITSGSVHVNPGRETRTINGPVSYRNCR